MEISNNQSLVNQAVAHLQELQNGFKCPDFSSYSKLKPLLDMDVNKDDIVIYFDLNKDVSFEVVFATTYEFDVLVAMSIKNIEVDTNDGTFTIDDAETKALLLEGKRIIHDAEHYKLLDSENFIETNFYSEVYA